MSLNIPASFVVVLVPRGNPSSASAGHSMAYISRAAKGMNDGDAVLRKALAWSIINVMRAQGDVPIIVEIEEAALLASSL
jgi:hypothetical protein